MKNGYYIGRFQFDSYAEYKKGLEDVKKIKYISDEVDVHEPGVALRLYTLIRQDDIKFQSVIGEDYLLYLSDLLADDYKELSDESSPYLAGLGKKHSPRRLAGILCILVAVGCFVYFLGSEWANYQKARELQELQESRELSRAAQYIADALMGIQSNGEQQVSEEDYAAESESQEQVSVSVPLEILPEYQELHEVNPDMVGWITIPNTIIDYPVVQHPDNNKYYLKHSFYQEEDSNGCVFLDTRNSLEAQNTNLIIYGHNMRSGMMFGELKEYQDEAYLVEHPQIQFNTLYEARKYDIIAVCLAKVAYQDEDVFRYYNYLGTGGQEEFQEFKTNVEQMNIYGNAVDIEYGDELITLSTCNNYIEDGRLFLVAKRVE